MAVNSVTDSMPGAANIEDLIALNQEILALARAKAPVARELLTAAHQMPSGAATLARRIAEEMQRGASLDQAVAKQTGELPEFYTAVVTAGVRSGRLTSALEGLTRALARMVALRRRIMLSLSYPLFLVAAVWVLLVFFAQHLGPLFEWVGFRRPLALDALRVSPSAFWVTALSVPVLLVVYATVQYWRAAHPRRSFSTGVWLFDRLPGAQSVCRLTAYANFTEVLQLLVAHRTPLPEALRAAADSVGWKQLSTPAGMLASELERGDPLNAHSPALRGLPPMVRMSLLAGDTPERLSKSLWHAAAAYHERASVALSNLAMLLPAAATAVIGGSVVAVYGLMVLGPYFAALREISTWTH
ncbi:MAG: type II secretion system F family protein [Planctomycetales bacterium]|nr:type II secretion system F family protein [Planctomycetales bacterium]